MFKLPPLIGQPPMKIAITGVDPATELGQQAIREAQGVTMKFVQRARMAGGGEGQNNYARQRLAGGGQLRYSSIGGQETLHAHLAATPSGVEEASEVSDKTISNPLLAVDVVFDSRTFTTFDVLYGSNYPIYFHGKYFDWTRFFIVRLVRNPGTDKESFITNAAPNYYDTFDPDFVYAGLAETIAQPGDAVVDAPSVYLVDPPDPMVATDGSGPAFMLKSAPGYFADGFAIRPRPGESSVPFDVYLAATNSVLSGDLRPGSSADPSVVPISYFTDVTYQIRLRAYDRDRITANWAINSHMAGRGWQEVYNNPGHASPYWEPTTWPGSDGRTDCGRIIVASDWQYAGGSPGDPRQKGMGRVLAETPKTTRTVGGPSARPSNGADWYNAMIWNDPTSHMTKVASCIWFPNRKVAAIKSVV